MVLFILILFVLSLFVDIRGPAIGCGLFGFSGKRPVDEVKLRWLAVENEKRGDHSTGVYANKNVYKNAVKASEFILDPGFRQTIRGACTVQGHTRQATKGAAVTRNAHPFMYKPIKGHVEQESWKDVVVGAHNGFLIEDLEHYHKELLGFKGTFEVDSQMIFATLSKFGSIDKIAQLEGAMALSFMFTETHPDTLFLYKRGETRELHIGEASDGLYYSSKPEPLQYIGCKNVWSLVPNTLYTLSKGEIIDVYQMPEPVLKSLAAGVQRLSWRQGTPVAEINALPTGALSVTHQYVGWGKVGKKWEGKGRQLDLDEYDFGNKNKQALVDPYFKGGQDIDSIEAKFNMLVANIRQELKGMEVKPINLNSTSLRSIDDLESCFVGVMLKTKEHATPLSAWFIGAMEIPDVNALTSMNGYAIFRIPKKLCNSKIKLQAYAPIDGIGPYEFEVEPKPGRVLEVTLLIPFCEKVDEKEEKSNTLDLESPEATSGSGSVAGPIHPLTVERGGLHEGASDKARKLLLGPSPLISGGDKSSETTGTIDSKRYPSETVSKSQVSLLKDLSPVSDNPKIEFQPKKLIPSIPETDFKLFLIDNLIKSDSNGKYCNFKDLKDEVWLWSINQKPFHVWLHFYQTVFKEEINAGDLVVDAARLQCYDKQIQKQWYHFHIYIEILLIYRWVDYVRVEYLEKHPFTLAQTFYPSTILNSKFDVDKYYSSARETGQEDNKKKFRFAPSKINNQRKLQFLNFIQFILWRLSIKTIYEVTKKGLNEVKAHSDRVHELVVKANEILSQDTDISETDMRELLIEFRDFFKYEAEDLDTFISCAESAILKESKL